MKTKFTFLPVFAFSCFSMTAQVVNDTIAKPTDSIALKQIEIQKAKETAATLSPEQAAALQKMAAQKQKEAEKMKAAAEKQAKALEKEQRKLEKEQKQFAKEQKKIASEEKDLIKIKEKLNDEKKILKR